MYTYLYEQNNKHHSFCYLLYILSILVKNVLSHKHDGMTIIHNNMYIYSYARVHMIYIALYQWRLCSLFMMAASSILHIKIKSKTTIDICSGVADERAMGAPSPPLEFVYCWCLIVALIYVYNSLNRCNKIIMYLNSTSPPLN